MACLAFLVVILRPALDYTVEEGMILTPAMQISGIWRPSALVVGIALMILFGVAQLARTAKISDVILSGAIIAGTGGLLYAGGPLFTAMGNYKLVVFFVLLVGACVAIGIPIAFAFGLGTFAFLAFTTRTPLSVVVGSIDEGMSHLILLSVPLFVFLGLMIEITGMARRMVNFLASMIGHVRGGLQYVLVVAMYLVSGISGSKAADMAAVTPVLFPELQKRGAKPGDLIALLSATGAQTETVPPSLVLITMGSATSVSIGALFTGGILPSILLGIVLCSVVWWRYRREDLGSVTRAKWGEAGRAFVVALPALILPFIIRAAVVEGIATATEVSTIGIVYTLIYGIIASALMGERIEWRRLLPSLVSTASLSGAILLIIGAASAMAWALTQSGFSHQLAAAMTGLPGGAVTFMALSIVMFVILGSILEGIPAIVLFGPLMVPIAKEVGLHEVHYAIVVILAMGIGLFSPPFGVGYYSACAIGRVDPADGARAILPYFAALVVGLIAVAAVPWLSIGLLK
jgi:tripartite ATP-independent transporter DctM subunit